MVKPVIRVSTMTKLIFPIPACDVTVGGQQQPWCPVNRSCHRLDQRLQGGFRLVSWRQRNDFVVNVCNNAAACIPEPVQPDFQNVASDSLHNVFNKT